MLNLRKSLGLFSALLAATAVSRAADRVVIAEEVGATW